MSSSLDRMVNIFTGSDWQKWCNNMTPYLQSQGLWLHATGGDPRPDDSTTSDPDDIAAVQKEQVAWDREDMKTIGIIALRLSHSLHHYIGTTAQETWAALKVAFDKPSVPLIFTDFAYASAFRLSGKNPEEEIDHLFTHIKQLGRNGVTLPEL